MRAHLLPRATTPRSARSHARRALHDAGLDDCLETALSIISELVTNAFQALDAITGGTAIPGRITMGIYREPDGLLVEITDTAPTAPDLCTPDDQDECGRGLLLVAALATSWGIRPESGGKTVFAYIAADADHIPAPPS
jgi:hypothetical protein